MDHLIRTVILLWSLALTVGDVMRPIRTGDKPTVSRDETVTCLVSEECVIPCQSSYHDVIHWHNNERPVHTFYNGTDHLEYQDEAYKGRTALFTDQISKGNISLILRGVKIEDMGRYRCYSSIKSDKKEAFVNVNVKAPIKSVDIKITHNRITCSTNKVYPTPTISWNINGIPHEETLKDSQGLISLTSSLPIQPDQESHTYTCSVRSGDGQQTYKASLVQDKIEINSGENVTIRCPDSRGETGHFNLTLTFDDSSEVLSYSQTLPPINRKWKDAGIQITPEGNITLHNLDSDKHSGNYTCERTTAQSRQIMQTSVQINPGLNIILIIGVGVCVGVAVLLACVIITVICIKRNGGTHESSKNSEESKKPQHELALLPSNQQSKDQ